MIKATLDECRQMLVASEEAVPIVPGPGDKSWKIFFSDWLVEHGWTYVEFEEAMRNKYTKITGEAW